MDHFKKIPIRFYYGGEFLRNSDLLHRVGGKVAMSHVVLDKNVISKDCMAFDISLERC